MSAATAILNTRESLIEAAYQLQRESYRQFVFVMRYVLLLLEALRLENAIWEQMKQTAYEIGCTRRSGDDQRYEALVNHHRYLVQLHNKAYRRVNRRWYALNRGER